MEEEISYKDFTILYVDDDSNARRFLFSILEDEFKEIYTASDGVEGLDIYNEKKPDIILADIFMPKMDGLSMIRKIREVDKNIPIIIVSAFDDKETLLQAINVESNGFITKPITLANLYERFDYIAKKLFENRQTLLNKDKKIKNLYKLAHYDNLTQIPNKYLFEISLEKALSRAKREDHSLALFFIDLDNFKAANDIYGHKIGDKVLTTVTKNIKKIIRKEDLFARRSGDEFLLLVENISNKEQLDILAQKITKATSIDVGTSKKTIKITSSIGISRYPQDAKDIHQLMHFADLAMYKAKKEGKNRYFFYK